MAQVLSDLEVKLHKSKFCIFQDGANPETSRKVLDQDGYAACQNLAQYYQMVSSA